jgi:flagellar hook-length control protein FliK
VQVRLRCQAGSITAQLTAETAAGAQALSQAGDDLRRSLQSQGVNLLALEVRVAGDGVGAETGGHQHEGGAGTPGGGPARPDETEEITIETSRLPDPGAQVDVLA